MAWQPSSKKNKSGISYLLIVLVFALLIWGVFVFFKFKIKEIENGRKSGFQTTNKTDFKHLEFYEYGKLNSEFGKINDHLRKKKYSSNKFS